MRTGKGVGSLNKENLEESSHFIASCRKLPLSVAQAAHDWLKPVPIVAWQLSKQFHFVGFTAMIVISN